MICAGRLFADFIRNELRNWEQEFPDKFFDMVYRIYGLRRKNPKVGILSIGEEEHKGNELTRSATPILK